jgi:hypothetical protein
MKKLKSFFNRKKERRRRIRGSRRSSSEVVYMIQKRLRTFSFVMFEPTLQKQIVAKCEKTHTSHHLMFIQTCEDFKGCKTRQELLRCFNLIFSIYIQDLSRHEVNLSSNAKLKLKHVFENPQMYSTVQLRDIFKQSTCEVKKLITNNQLFGLQI